MLAQKRGDKAGDRRNALLVVSRTTPSPPNPRLEGEDFTAAFKPSASTGGLQSSVQASPSTGGLHSSVQASPSTGGLRSSVQALPFKGRTSKQRSSPPLQGEGWVGMVFPRCINRRTWLFRFGDHARREHLSVGAASAAMLVVRRASRLKPLLQKECKNARARKMLRVIYRVQAQRSRRRCVRDDRPDASA